MESSPCPRRLTCVTGRAYSTGSPYGSPGILVKISLWPLPGAPGRIRTRDPLLRRQLLYPAELQAPTERILQDLGNAEATSPGYPAVFATCPRPGTRGQEDQQPPEGL